MRVLEYACRCFGLALIMLSFLTLANAQVDIIDLEQLAATDCSNCTDRTTGCPESALNGHCNTKTCKVGFWGRVLQYSCPSACKCQELKENSQVIPEEDANAAKEKKCECKA